MRIWLVELAAALTLFVAGIWLWTLPSSTPVIGHPPEAFGWICLVGALLLGVLSTANLVGFEVHIRRRGKTAPVDRPAGVVKPVTTTAPAPLTDRGLRSEAHDLVKLANTPDLTRAQVDRLLEPRKGKWLPIEGTVRDVIAKPNWAGLSLKDVNGDPALTALAYFNTSDGAEAYDRAIAMNRGAHVRLRGKFVSVEGSGQIGLDPSEFID